MVNSHRRSSSIPTSRLSHPLPPLPINLDDIRPRNVPDITILPYHDDPSEDIGRSPMFADNLPPSYEPMYDYLRSQQRTIQLLHPSRQDCHTSPPPEGEEPYHDQPIVITIDHDISQPPPPSYEELYIENQSHRELRTLIPEFEIDSVPAEEFCKFVVAMILIALTVALVGTAFHWGRLGCNGPQC
jgi:hypothetical protein